MPDILHTVEIATTPDRLYDALTTPRGLAGWWTPQVTAAPHVGAVNELHFGGVTLAVRVDELVPGRRVVWSGVEVPPDWARMRVIFEIDPRDDAVELTFRQTGLPTAYEDFARFSYLWAQYLRSIKLLLETGTGEPFGSPGSKAGGTTPRRARAGAA